MSILSSVTHGTVTAGQRIVIAGNEKIGKTTLASYAPRPLLVPLEMGYAGVNVSKTNLLTDLPQVFQTCEEIIAACMAKKFPYQTVVWDTATALERLIHDYVLKSDINYQKNNAKGVTMESALGGYGKAYLRANELFATFTGYCDRLAFQFGINSILTCHVFAARVVDPTAGEFDVWDLLLHSPKNQKNYGKREMITQWADMVGFLYEPIMVIINDKQQLSRAVSTNRGRVLGLERTPNYVAGNRYGLTGEISIPRPPENGWNYLANAIYQAKGIDIFNRD